MTEIYFNDLIARVGVATIAMALESVTATVIDLYAHWKPGFRFKLEASLSSGLRFNGLGYKDLIPRQPQLEWSVCWRGGFNDSITWQHLLCCSVHWTRCLKSSTLWP